MKGDSLPEGVRLFLFQSIDSVPELELLLLLADRAADLDAAEAAARVYVDEPAVRALLERLMRRRLVAAHGKPPRYRFAPQEAEDERLVRQLSQAYRTHLVAMANLIHSKASGSVQEFARAFDLKKDR
jgi:predicted ArsR family transcriptional regulator